MEIKRKIYNRILEWKKQTDGKKALLIEGLRHEILNEPSREKVFSDVFEWINKRI